MLLHVEGDIPKVLHIDKAFRVYQLKFHKKYILPVKNVLCDLKSGNCGITAITFGI